MRQRTKKKLIDDDKKNVIYLKEEIGVRGIKSPSHYFLLQQAAGPVLAAELSSSAPLHCFLPRRVKIQYSSLAPEHYVIRRQTTTFHLCSHTPEDKNISKQRLNLKNKINKKDISVDFLREMRDVFVDSEAEGFIHLSPDVLTVNKHQHQT